MHREALRSHRLRAARWRGHCGCLPFGRQSDRNFRGRRLRRAGGRPWLSGLQQAANERQRVGAGLGLCLQQTQHRSRFGKAQRRPALRALQRGSTGGQRWHHGPQPLPVVLGQHGAAAAEQLGHRHRTARHTRQAELQQGLAQRLEALRPSQVHPVGAIQQWPPWLEPPPAAIEPGAQRVHHIGLQMSADAQAAIAAAPRHLVAPQHLLADALHGLAEDRIPWARLSECNGEDIAHDGR